MSQWGSAARDGERGPSDDPELPEAGALRPLRAAGNRDQIPPRPFGQPEGARRRHGGTSACPLQVPGSMGPSVFRRRRPLGFLPWIVGLAMRGMDASTRRG